MKDFLSGKTLLAMTFGVSLALAGCGGSSGGGSPSQGSSADEQPVTSGYSEVEGPLDAVQQPLSEQVIAPLASAAAGTPLEGAVNCVGGFVVTDVLDILDAILSQVSPESLADPAAFGPALQESVTELATDLPAALASLTGESCTGGSAGESGSNPLEGTPLAPLGDALAPVFAAANGGGDSGGEAPSAAALMEQLSAAFSEGLAAVIAADPSGEAATAPILGGLLVTLDQAFIDLTATVTALESTDAEQVGAAVATTLENTLNNLLIQVVPIGFIEEQAGQGPIISSEIEAAVATLTGLLGGDLSGLAATDFAALFGDGAGDLFGPLSDTPLAGIQEAITGALAGGGDGGQTGGTTGTPLDAILDQLAPIQDALSAGGGDGLTGTPLDILLGPIASALEGGGACPLAATPLDAVCGLVSQLQAALTLDPNADPLALLEGLLGGLLGGLQP
jgi:hypothetical protein|tara:strand:- start:266 stop:1618 length:1353 start_codon:yes stop_codon:yes gene_type:complete